LNILKQPFSKHKQPFSKENYLQRGVVLRLLDGAVDTR